MASIVALSGGTTLGGSYCAAAVETNRTKVREADRKSTRLNSSQGYISYAVFCLKKKKKIIRSAVMNTPLSFRAPLVQDALPCFRNARLAPPIIVASAAVDSLASHTSPRRSVYPY